MKRRHGLMYWLFWGGACFIFAGLLLLAALLSRFVDVHVSLR